MSAAVPNIFQGGATPPYRTLPPGASQGLCTLSAMGQTFQFRTNPNEIWWSYEMTRNIENTYGGRVIQLLGTRLGDLSIKIEMGGGSWAYLIQTVGFLRDLLNDQRYGNTATFFYSTRNWSLNLYAMNIPFEDQMTATTRELQVNFKIQEDLNGILTQVTLDAELQRLQMGTYPPGTAHNPFNDAATTGGGTPMDFQNPSGPTYPPSGVVNSVDDDPEGDNPGGLNPAAGLITGNSLPTIPGFGPMLGG